MKLLFALALLATGPASFNLCQTSAYAQGGCCKVCKKGKACGNSCISVDKTCHQPPGCACDG